MSIALALVPCVTLLRAWLCIRQQRRWSGAPAPALSRLRQQLLSGLLQGLAAAAALAWLRVAAPRGVLAGAVTLVGLACVPVVLDSLARAAQALLQRKKMDLPQLLRGPALCGAAALPLVPLALFLWCLTPAAWWFCFVAVVASGSGRVVDLYRGLARHHCGGAPVDPALERRLHGCLRRWGHGAVRLRIERSAPDKPQFNARAEPCGPAGAVLLSDALAQQLPPQQVEAVVAHELGHLACAHLRRRHWLLAGVWLVVLGLATLLLRNTHATEGWRRLGEILVLAPSLRFLLQPLVMGCLRRWELQADAYAARLVPPVELAHALGRLFDLNQVPSVSDTWFALFHDSHPLLDRRVAHLAAS